LKANCNPQLGPAAALVQLLTEYPDLPRLAWRVSEIDPLSDTLHGSGGRDSDPRSVIEPWAQVLGAEVRRTPFTFEGVECLEFRVETDWRDVRVRIVLSCPASVLAVAVAA
jgi:hypothetical protein